MIGPCECSEQNPKYEKFYKTNDEVSSKISGKKEKKDWGGAYKLK